MLKNVSGQEIYVYAYNASTGLPVTSDGANITAELSLDGAALAATDDTNPTEVGGGFYAFSATQAETNADAILVVAESATANVIVIGAPAVIVTRPEIAGFTGIDGTE